MNRTQRRAAMRAEKRRSAMAQEVKNIQIVTNYGYDDTHVLMQFSQSITNQRLTPDQARAVIAHLQDALDKLLQHQKAVAEGRTTALAKQFAPGASRSTR